MSTVTRLANSLLAGSALLALAAAASPTVVAAEAVNTGDASGAYHTSFCPKLTAELGKAKLDYECRTSAGTAENLKRVLAEPRQLGFGQLDILALEGALTGSPPPVVLLRRDDARECLFAVTRNKEIAAWGDLAAGASKLRFILPPADSGSAGTFRYLRQIDPDGIGRAPAPTNAPTTDDAIRQALSADDTVTLFVQVPDPDNARFKLVGELGGHFVPVIDRAILRPQVAGEKIYFAEETQVANASWSKTGTKVTTACTPLTLFTGAPERVTGDKARADHADLIATVKALPAEALLPAENTLSRLVRRTKELSAASAEQLLKYSEEAREKAKPYWERAKEASEKAIEAAKPALDKATEMGRQVLDKAKQEAKELMEGDKGSEPKPKP